MAADRTMTDADKPLEFRNRNLGSMFCSECAADYLHVLCTLLDFRRRHELEVLRDDLFQAATRSPWKKCFTIQGNRDNLIFS